MKILFVCTGNSCRSVIAHYLLEKLARERGLAWEVRSCGIAAEKSFPIPHGVHKALAQRGVPQVRHVPQPLTRELMDWADLALAMTRMHRDFLHDQFPEHRSKAALLLDLVPELAGRDVDDPIGQPDAAYFECRDRLEIALTALLERHATEKR